MGNKRGNEDADADEGASDADAQLPKKSTEPKATASKGKEPLKAKTVKKPKFNESGEGSGEESKQPAIEASKVAEGDQYVDLGKKKRAAVRSFKGQVYVDIREYYGTEGEEKPGKKGITLALEQWEALKRAVNTIDSLFAEQGKK